MYWHKKRLKIDLSSSSFKVEEIKQAILEQYLGGVGLGTYYLNKEVDPRTDALNPSNMINLCTGPLQGTKVTLTGRFSLVSKSPLTGFYLDSNSGGNVGPFIKFLGYDLISILGQADHPVYLYLSDDDIEFHDASFLWGKETDQVEKVLKKKYDSPRASVISIGPAGENLIGYSCTANDRHRNFGRGGSGALFGAKKLKAIVFDPKQQDLIETEELKPVVKNIRDRVVTARKAGHELHSKGTSWLVKVSNDLSMYPTYNFQQGVFEDYEKITGEQLHTQYKTRKRPCYRCSLGCTHIIELEYPLFDNKELKEVQVPEYETLGLCGSNLGISDLKTIIQINHRCNALGLDTISTGSSLSFLTELKEKDLLPPSLADYKSKIPDFGDAQQYLTLIDTIAEQDGKIAEFVALGPAEMANQSKNPVEAKKFANVVKSLPFAAWDPRGKFIMGLSYGTAAVGASHLRGWPSTSKIPEKYDPNNPDHEKIFDSFIEQVDLKILKDALIVCHFTHSIDPAFSLSDCKNISSILLKKDMTIEDVRTIAQRIWRDQRQFNNAIIKARDEKPIDYDQLPYRMMQEPTPKGRARGKTAFVSQKEYQALLKKYYQRRELNQYGFLEES